MADRAGTFAGKRAEDTAVMAADADADADAVRIGAGAVRRSA